MSIVRRFFKRGGPGKGADRLAVGYAGEEEAARVLEKKGLRIIGRNFRTRFGEIDVIAMDGDTVVFVEVKTRSGDSFGLPKEAVGEGKRRHILKAASVYLAGNPRFAASPVRFDVIGIDMGGARLGFEHIENAFDAGE